MKDGSAKIDNRSTNWKTAAKNGKWKREMEKETMAAELFT